MFSSRQQIVDSLQVFAERHYGENIKKEIISNIAGTANFSSLGQLTDSLVNVGSSKIGGLPDLPQNYEWPVRGLYGNLDQRLEWPQKNASAPDSDWPWATPEQCEAFRQDYREVIEILKKPFPLQFIGQINFGEIKDAREMGLPEKGLLSVFYDTFEFPGGFYPEDVEGYRVLYFENVDESFSPRTEPAEFKGVTRYEKHKLSGLDFKSVYLTPMPGADELNKLKFSNDEEDFYSDWWNEEIHQKLKGPIVGGQMQPIQGDMRSWCALTSAGVSCGHHEVYEDPNNQEILKNAFDWKFVCQFNSIEELNMMFGDVGSLYVLMHQDDLAKKNFSKARMVFQCG